MWPRKDGNSTSPTRSVLAERGLANWPAIRPTLTTGTPAAYVSATAICKMIFSLSRMESALNSANDSAQSPACNKKALPSATSRQLRRQKPGLTREDERWHRRQPRFGAS